MSGARTLFEYVIKETGQHHTRGKCNSIYLAYTIIMSSISMSISDFRSKSIELLLGPLIRTITVWTKQVYLVSLHHRSLCHAHTHKGQYDRWCACQPTRLYRCCTLFVLLVRLSYGCVSLPRARMSPVVLWGR